MKVVKARNQKPINFTAVEPIRHGDILKEAPAEQRESVATTSFRPASFLSVQPTLTVYDNPSVGQNSRLVEQIE